MAFISFEFLVLVALTLCLYYVPKLRRFQVIVLVSASLVFYAWDQWRLLPLLLLAVAVTYCAMLGAIRRNKVLAVLGIAGNIAILVFFKYKFLIVPQPSRIEAGSETIDFLLQLPLPIGISFFVFHNISLIADYYKYGRERSMPTPLQVLLYILFFPQLVSGPITSAISFLPQIEAEFLRDVPWVQAAQLLITGLFFKLFCANNLAQFTALMAPELSANSGGGDKFFLTMVYGFQIYADFYGYSTIALGLALLFGYRLPVNFKLPYIASSFSDFWNRWHISLSRWLKTYLYIPLGGNRISPARTYFNLFVVMVLGGLWHGAALLYAVWGFAHGTLLAVERFAAQLVERHAPKYYFNIPVKFGYSLFVFVCVSLCWLMFRFQDFSQASAYFLSMVDNPLQFRLAATTYLFALLYMSPVIMQHALSGRITLSGQNKMVSGLFFGGLLWLAFAERGVDSQFIYFRF